MEVCDGQEVGSIVRGNIFNGAGVSDLVAAGETVMGKMEQRLRCVVYIDLVSCQEK